MASGSCDSCQNAHRYKCPACGALSCSLSCVNAHKLKFQCTGQIDPTAFLPKEDLLTLTALDRDYNFLQRIGRDIVLQKNDAHTHRVIKPRDQWRAGVRVHSVGKGMSRNRKNRSKWNNLDKCFEWTVEIKKASGSEYTQIGDKTPVSSLPALLAYPDSFQVFLIDVHGTKNFLRKDLSFQDAIRGKDVLEFPTLEFQEAPELNGSSSASSNSSSDDSSSDDTSSDESGANKEGNHNSNNIADPGILNSNFTNLKATEIEAENGTLAHSEQSQQQLKSDMHAESDSEPEEESSKREVIYA